MRANFRDSQGQVWVSRGLIERRKQYSNGGSIPPLISQLRGIDAPDIAMLKVQSRCKTSYDLSLIHI